MAANLDIVISTTRWHYSLISWMFYTARSCLYTGKFSHLHPTIHPSTHQPIHPSPPSIYPFTHPPIHLSIRPSIHLPIRPSIYLPLHALSIHKHILSSDCSPIHPSLHSHTHIFIQKLKPQARHWGFRSGQIWRLPCTLRVSIFSRGKTDSK